MAAVAATTQRKLRGTSTQSFRIADAQQLFAGSYVCLNSSGLLVPFSGANGQILLGRCEGPAGQVDSSGQTTLLGAAGASIPPEATVNLDGEILEKITVAGASSLALAVGQPVYLNGTDNPGADATLTRPTTGSQPFGVVVRWYSGTTCDVYVPSFAERYLASRVGNGKQALSLGHFECVSFAGAGPTNLGINLPAPFHGRILSVFAFVTVAPTGAAGTVSLTPSIAGTVTTGGVVVVATGDAAFARKAGTAITAANEFHEGDNLSLSEASVTAMTAGAFEFWALVEQLPGV